MKPLMTGLVEPEGPLALDDGRWLVVEMDPSRGCVSLIDPADDSLSVVRKTGRPNGLATAANGDIYVAESLVPSLLRITLDGECEVVLTADEHGEDFLFPNDLCFGPDGALYMTDSGIMHADIVVDGALRQDWSTAPYDGKVFRIDIGSGKIETIDSGLKFLNGISIGVDNALYTNDTITGDVYRYDLDGGAVGERTVFGNVIDPELPVEFRGPDGMAHGADGRLYVTVYNQHEIVVLDTDGKWDSRVRTEGNNPTNVAFGLTDNRMYVTETELGQLEVHDAETSGAPLFHG